MRLLGLVVAISAFSASFCSSTALAHRRIGSKLRTTPDAASATEMNTGVSTTEAVTGESASAHISGALEGCDLSELKVLSSDEKQNLISKFAGSQAPSRSDPKFFITIGPSASGKATVAKKAMMQISNRTGEESEFARIVVDEIVESYPKYAEIKTRCHDKSQSQRLYYGIRKDFGVDDLSDDALNDALSGKRDIVWETTGENIAWVVQEAERIKRLGYEVILLYPFVATSSLLERALQRQRDTGQEPAPPDQITRTARLASKNTILMMQKGHADRLMLFDNNGERGDEKLVLDIKNTYRWTKDDELSQEQVEQGFVFKGPGHYHEPKKCDCQYAFSWAAAHQDNERSITRFKELQNSDAAMTFSLFLKDSCGELCLQEQKRMMKSACRLDYGIVLP